MNRIIITVDLGHFKAYRISKNPQESFRTELIDSYDIIEGQSRMGEKLSDGAGRFGMGGGKNGAAKGYGEPHNIELESEKKLTLQLAKDINSLIAKEDCDSWFLAAGNTILNQIKENLEPAVRARLNKSIPANLTKTPKSEILDHFK